MSEDKVTRINIGGDPIGINGQVKAVGSVPPQNKLKEWLLDAAKR
ncbi:MAG: hypothetical protein R6U27_06470 [Desulfobacterales bacterium]